MLKKITRRGCSYCIFAPQKKRAAFRKNATDFFEEVWVLYMGHINCPAHKITKCFVLCTRDVTIGRSGLAPISFTACDTDVFFTSPVSYTHLTLPTSDGV